MRRDDSSDLKLDSKLTNILLEFFPDGIVAFDLEMTGLSPIFDKIIEIAGVKLDSQGELSFFHKMVNPLVPIPEHTIKYHGITNDDIKEEASLKKPLKEFLDFFGNLPLVAHNAQFDIGYIVKANYEYGYPFSLSSIYDSCKFSRMLYKKRKDAPPNFKLSTLADFYNIEFQHHRALDDSMASLKVLGNGLLEFKKGLRKENLKELAFLFKLNSFKKPLNYILPKKLEALRENVQKQQDIHIKYRGGTKGDEFRPVTPISILPMPNGLVLYGKCLLTEQNKHFLVKKIKDVKL